MAMVVGLSIDGARSYSVASRVGAALDSAALAGAKMLNETDSTDAQVTTAVLATLDADLANLHVGGVTFVNRTVTIDRPNSAVTVKNDIAVQTMFGRLAGAPSIVFNKSSTTTYDVAKIELVLALDLTGSMNQIPTGDTVPKITTLKSVASELVNSLYDMAATDSNIRIGIVPWSSAVNAGPYASLVNGTSSSSGWSSPTWGSGWSSSDCVVERGGSGAVTDDAPGPMNYASGSGSASCPDEDVLPLIGRTERASVLATINGFNASGSTAGHIGTAWGWYLISPKWASFFPSGSRPDAYGTSTAKNVIIMTDGIFNTDYVSGSSGSSGGYDDTSYSLFQQNCSGMRAQGINVYTIALDLTDARAQTELQACAGASANYFNAANSTQLRAAFVAIIAKLTKVRVSK